MYKEEGFRSYLLKNTKWLFECNVLQVMRMGLVFEDPATFVEFKMMLSSQYEGPSKEVGVAMSPASGKGRSDDNKLSKQEITAISGVPQNQKNVYF